jgi:hypothetical protein
MHHRQGLFLHMKEPVGDSSDMRVTPESGFTQLVHLRSFEC